jgi:predicted transglutaminase-like cysteine proteinase
MGGLPGLKALALAGLALAGCAALPAAGPSYHFVKGSSPGDSAHAKIARWQERERAGSPALSPQPASLGADFSLFVSAERRALAARVGAWIQAEARARYLPDAGADRWPTAAEVFASSGDDCDGLELLALHALRTLGFPEEALFRAVIERPGDGVQHMVTLWFETPGDPLVIDPTGFAAESVLPLSVLEGWTPRAIFTEQAEYRVEGPVLAPAGAPR